MRSDLSLSVVSHDRLVDTFQRRGAHLGSTFVYGGIHPRLAYVTSHSTKKWTLPRVVCPLDYPSSDSTPFGKTVL